MLLDDETIGRFQLVYEATYGCSINTDKAREIAQRVLTLYALLLRPHAKDQESTSPKAQ